jgi:hypothetical protein
MDDEVDPETPDAARGKDKAQDGLTQLKRLRRRAAERDENGSGSSGGPSV